MKYPVDLLANVRPESLEQSGIEHMVKLTTEKTEDYLSLSESQDIKIGWNNVSLVPVYGDRRKLKVLALSIPGGPFEAVGLFLQGQWWSAEDILKTANPLRTGLLKVSTPVEKIVLYVLNKIIYRTKEMADDEEGFLYHGEDDFAKILWEGGEAIGFYSVKPKGSIFCKSLPDDFPVMDTIFVRRCHRGKGHGFNMLRDFVDNFRMEHLGLKGPLSSTIYQVCEKYLSANPADSKLLWVVNKTGNYSTRTQIAKNQQTMKLKGNNCGQVECNLSFDAEDTEHLMETTEYTEVVEEVVWNTITKDIKDTAVETCDRSSTFGCNTTRKKTIETTVNIRRTEDTESGVQSPGDEQLPEYHKHSLTVKETDSKNTDAVMHREAMPEMTYCSCNNQKVVTPEFEDSLLDNPAPTTTQEVTVTPEEAVEKEQVIKTNHDLNIQSIKNNGVAHTSNSSRTNISPVDCQPQELLQDLEFGIVKVASEIKDVKNMMPQHDKAEDDEDMIDKETYEILETQIHKEQTDIAENTKKDQKVELAHKEKGYDLKEEKSNIMSKLVDEEDLDRDNNKASTGKRGRKRKFQYDSPVRHSKVLWNELPESELTNRVLRSSIKEAQNQQMRSPQQTKSSKRPKKPEKGRCHKVDIDQETPKVTSTERDREESQEDNILQQLEPQLIDKTGHFSIEKSDKIPNEIMETEEGAEKDDDRLSESNVTDRMVDFQKDKPVKECKTVGATGEIIDEKMHFEDDDASKSTEDNINDVQEEPVNQSNIAHDQPTKSKLIKKVLRISTKPDIATSKKSKAIKHQKKTKQAVIEPSEQKKDVVESHSKAGQSDRDIVMESTNVETEHLDQAAVNVRYIIGVENKMKDGLLDISITDATFRNDEQNNTAREDKLKAAKHVAAESDEAQKKKPATKGMPAENKTEESIVVLMLKKSVDKSECAKETLQSQEETDQDLQGLGGTDGTDGREERQKGLQQSQAQSESTENEQVEEVSENENVETDEVMNQTGHCSSQESEEIIYKKMEIEENVDAPESADKDKYKIEELQDKPEPVEKTKTVEDKVRKPTDFTESSQGKKKLVIPNILIELVDKDNSNLGKTVVKLGLEKPEEEILDEELPFEMTKHLRYRTVVISPRQRKSKRLSKQVVTPHRKKIELNTNSKNIHENKEACEKTSQNIDSSDIAEKINVTGEDTGMKIMAQVEEKSEEDLMEEITKAESANKGNKLNKSQHERQQNENMADEEAEASVTDTDFTLELDEEVPEHVIVKESKTLHKECEKEATCEEDIPDVTTKQVPPKQRSPRQSRSLIQESLSYTGERSMEEEVKKVVEAEEENKPQQKRKAIKLTARRSKRFAKP